MSTETPPVAPHVSPVTSLNGPRALQILSTEAAGSEAVWISVAGAVVVFGFSPSWPLGASLDDRRNCRLLPSTEKPPLAGTEE